MNYTHPQNAVGVLPFNEKLGFTPSKYPLDKLIWPLGQPDQLKGGRLSDLGQEDHLILPPRSTSYYRPGFGTRAKVSTVVLEPAIISQRHLKRLRFFHRRFFRVLTAYEPLLEQIPNGVFFPFGSTWVPDWKDLDTTKSEMTSLIASAKRSQPGHFIRHETAIWAAKDKSIKLKAIGSGYQPFEHKHEGLAPYRFSVVIENAFERNYFTEKLIDAILCDTVPIYLGCPNIEDFFNIKGMIVCQNLNEIKTAVRSATPELYEEMKEDLLRIKPVAHHYGSVFERAASAVLAAPKHDGIPKAATSVQI